MIKKKLDKDKRAVIKRREDLDAPRVIRAHSLAPQSCESVQLPFTQTSRASSEKHSNKQSFVKGQDTTAHIHFIDFS